MASDAPDLPLQPNDGLTTPDLYIHTTGYLVQRDKFLHVLGMASIGWRRQFVNLPSWVPDFSCSRRSTILNMDQFSAARPVTEFVKVYQSIFLSTAAFFVDQVAETMPMMPEIIRNSGMAEQLQNRTELYGWFWTTRSWVKRNMRLPSRDKSEMTYWRTLLCDSPLSPGLPNSMHTSSEYSKVFGDIVKFIKLSLEFKPNPSGSRELLDVAYFVLLEQRDSLTRIMLQSRDRRLFCNKKGYIDPGPAGLEIGDDVCCLDGAPTPFLLRATLSDRTRYKPYRLVDEAYIHGLMEGEGRRIGDKKRVTFI